MRRILCACLVLALCLCLCSCKSSDYRDAMSLYETGEYAQAIVMFETLGDYRDSMEMVRKCNYETAVSLMESGRYEDAIPFFEALGDYEDSARKIADCELALRYNKAIALMDAGNFEEAVAVLETLDGYKDSANLLETCNTAILDGKYDDAVALMGHDPVQAFEALIALDGYKDSAQIADSIYENYETEKIKAAQVGDTILFGNYDQDMNRSNGREYIEWLVLEQKNNKILVLSKYGLDWQPYEDNFFKKGVLWSNCSLRKWLNETFISTAFSSSEQSRIARSGQDHVFLLNSAEVDDYLPSESLRQCQPTDYAVAHGAEMVDPSLGVCRWWLRVEKTRNFVMAAEYADYTLVAWEWPVFKNGVGLCPSFAVRPAMWISTES